MSLNNTRALLTIDPNKGLRKKAISTGTYWSNNLSGFTITVTSDNDGLKDINNAENVIPYTVYLDNGTGVLASALGTSGAFITTGGPSLTSEKFKIKVSVADREALWAAGTYSDILRFTITSND